MASDEGIILLCSPTGSTMQWEERGFLGSFLPHDIMQSCSVCLSVRLSRSCILSKQVNISSNFFVIR